MLCKRLKNLPLVKEQVKSGKLGYTAARVIAPISDQSNEKKWVDFAVTHSRRELEREVKQAKQVAVDAAKGQPTLLPVPANRPAAIVPVRVTMEMTPTQFARYEKLWAQIRRQGGMPVDKTEVLLEIMQTFTVGICPRGQKSAPNKPPVQIHIHQCDDCRQASLQTSKGELKISETELEQAQCDCQISRSGERNKASISPAVRREVLAKYRHKCQQPGCRHTQYLHIHHIIPRTEGGSNELQNLTVLCSACHGLLHSTKPNSSESLVKSPQATYSWQTERHPNQTTTLRPTNSITIASPRWPLPSANSTSVSTASTSRPGNCPRTSAKSCNHSNRGGPPVLRPN